MNTSEICTRYKFDNRKFNEWLTRLSGISTKTSVWSGLSVERESDVPKAIHGFKEYMSVAEARAADERADQERNDQLKRAALSSMLITSGFNFDGYKITKYSGYISGDDVVQIERGTSGFFSSATDVGGSLMKSLTAIRRNALMELKEAAYELGCNAVIGVDFDYLTLDPETASSSGGTMYLPYVFGVTANGNAVIIEQT